MLLLDDIKWQLLWVVWVVWGRQWKQHQWGKCRLEQFHSSSSRSQHSWGSGSWWAWRERKSQELRMSWAISRVRSSWSWTGVSSRWVTWTSLFCRLYFCLLRCLLRQLSPSYWLLMARLQFYLFYLLSARVQRMRAGSWNSESVGSAVAGGDVWKGQVIACSLSMASSTFAQTFLFFFQATTSTTASNFFTHSRRRICTVRGRLPSLLAICWWATAQSWSSCWRREPMWEVCWLPLLE